LGAESDESSSAETADPTPEEAPQRFGRYELVRGEDGKPVELGRGGMGVTYKAFDVDLRFAVTLKVITLLRTRTLGFTLEAGYRGTESYGRRSAFHTYASGAIPDRHARTRCTRSANL
jgi:hypothetical protein